MNQSLFPWRAPGRLWRSLCHLMLGLPLGIVSFTVIITLLALTGGLLVTFLFALPVAWLLFVTSRGLGTLERSRTAALLDVQIADPIPPLQGETLLRRLGERVRSRPRWKEIVHHLLMLPVGTFCFSVVTAVWCGSVVMVALPTYVDALPGDRARLWFADIGQGAGSVAAALVGVVGVLLVAPWLTMGLATAQGAMAKGLLGPSRDAALARQVTALETRRSAAVDSAEAERRRIERDLHDGAQQRLVALAAGLGAAKEKLATDPEGGRALVADAHEEAKAALKEIRDLVRGIHPVILADRGLDAALSAVVARAPVPVALDVRLADRPSPTAESAAYFIVSEALTNVARHSQATRASVSIARAGDRMIVEIRDDGVGGADASLGTGLQGLRDRVSGLGGTMYVISPEGGPTTISVELPCGS